MTTAQIIKSVMSSSLEVELTALFINFRETVPAQRDIEEMGHKQPPTPMQTDNTMDHGAVTNNISSKRLKYMDMRFHWLRCQATQGQFRHLWKRGAINLVDYVTKHPAAIHHRTIRPTFLTPKTHQNILRKCAYSLATAAA